MKITEYQSIKVCYESRVDSQCYGWSAIVCDVHGVGVILNVNNE
jgi:hypothetical protein